MKCFKLLVCVFCLAVLSTACGGKIASKLSTPDKVYGNNTEIRETAFAGLMTKVRPPAPNAK